MGAATCQACGAHGLRDVYTAGDVPVHSCLLLDDRAAAEAFPRGALTLAFCPACGLLQNRAFDAALVDYSADYEDSQAHSPRFLEFAGEVIDHLAGRYGLSGGRVLEIGCGKGDFLVLLANRAGMRGVGFDPAWRPGPLVPDDPDAVRFVAEPFSADVRVDADLVCCRHTLEHVADARAFVSMVRRALGDARDTVVFFEVPDSMRILRETAFWDVYYEHCSYFTEVSLRRLFQRCGFEVLQLWHGFDGQYLLLTARPAEPAAPPPGGPEVDALAAEVEGFRRRLPGVLARLRDELDAAAARGERSVLWGASSKAVGYLTTLRAGAQVEAVVDINPVKHGRYLAGTGHPVVGPDALPGLRPDVVVVANPVYRDEVAGALAKRGIDATVRTL